MGVAVFDPIAFADHAAAIFVKDHASQAFLTQHVDRGSDLALCRLAVLGNDDIAVERFHADAAVIDAQKLVTVLPTSSRDRILLAQSYSAAGKGRWADRTLWAAFQEIPADEKIYAALQATKKGNAEGLKDLEEEFTRQRNNSLNRGFM